MLFRIFTLQPQFFDSFFTTSLIAKALKQDVFDTDIINWRDRYGVGNYKQIDDKPYGGSHGMVLQADPIYQALRDTNAISELFSPPSSPSPHTRIFPNNSRFEELVRSRLSLGLTTKNVTIHLTPRGFPLNQSVVEWLASSFNEITILCGRYEGFDARVNEMVDLELSLGNFVLNGGEVAASALIEAVSRLLPGFLVKEQSAEHDSFSSSRTIYRESMEYILGKQRMQQSSRIAKEYLHQEKIEKLFSNSLWQQTILPYIEHPHYSRPETWMNWTVPEVLMSGNHKKVDQWRKDWFRD